MLSVFVYPRRVGGGGQGQGRRDLALRHVQAREGRVQVLVAVGRQVSAQRGGALRPWRE